MSEWFEDWFGAEYLELYPHRDEPEAEALLDVLERRRVSMAGRFVLDLACGAGRHAAALERRGARVAALDLSRTLLFAARERGASNLVRADMRRLPLRTGTFDVALNLFTSFGYFATDEEHGGVVAEVARVLKPGGRFILDFLNADFVRSSLVPRDERTVDGHAVVQERRISPDGRFVIKHIHLLKDGRVFVERVRLFGRSELERLLTASGLAAEDAMGDYDGAPFEAASPRLILIARRW